MPVPPTVAIDVAPETAAYLTTAAVRGCEAALGEGGCVATRGSPLATPWRAQVVESSGSEPPSIAIRLFVGGSSVVYRTRLIEFSRTDAERQRWASVGVVIAAMVAAQQAEGGTQDAAPGELAPEGGIEPLPEAQPIEISPMDRGISPRASQASQAPIRFDLGAVVGTGSTTSLSYGGMLRLSSGLDGSPVFILVGASSTYTSGSFDSSFTSGGGGLGVRLGEWQQPLALEVRAEALLQYVSVRATRNGSESSDHRWRAGGKLGSDGIWAMTPNWHLVAGVEATLLRPEVVVEVVSESRAGSLPSVGWAGTVSLRFSD